MIKSLIYIEINAIDQISFNKPLLKRFQQKFPELSTYDMDGHSEESVRTYALDLARQSGKTAVLLDIKDPEAAASGVSSFLNQLIRLKKEPLLIIQQGEQPQLAQMAKVAAGEWFFQNLDEGAIEQKLEDFFTVT